MSKKLEKLLKEDSKWIRVKVPESIGKEVKKYQDAYRKLNGKGITKEHVLLIMWSYGLAGIKSETRHMKQAFLNQ